MQDTKYLCAAEGGRGQTGLRLRSRFEGIGYPDFKIIAVCGTDFEINSTESGIGDRGSGSLCRTAARRVISRESGSL